MIEERKGLNIVAIILGIISLILIPFKLIRIICAILSIIIAILGRKKGGKKLGIIGFICSIITIILIIAQPIVMGKIIFGDEICQGHPNEFLCRK